MSKDTMVTEPTGEVVDPTTLTAGVESTKEATPAQSSDAELQSIQDKYKALESDLNAMKSTFQRKEAIRSKEWEQREQTYLQQIEELRLATMDDEQRKVYESTATQRRAMELENQLNTVVARQAEAEAMLRAQNFFLAQGVPATSLNLDEGYDELWASGLEHLTAELADLRKQKVSKTSEKQEKPQVNAPSVVSSNNAPASAGTTWEALIKRLNVNSEDDVYRLIETGQLSPDVLPGLK